MSYQYDDIFLLSSFFLFHHFQNLWSFLHSSVSAEISKQGKLRLPLPKSAMVAALGVAMMTRDAVWLVSLMFLHRSMLAVMSFMQIDAAQSRSVQIATDQCSAKRISADHVRSVQRTSSPWRPLKPDSIDHRLHHEWPVDESVAKNIDKPARETKIRAVTIVGHLLRAK